jgi:VanZ family protein
MPSQPEARKRHHGIADWLLRWAPVLVWMFIIFMLSSQASLPRAPSDALDVALKKLGHGAGYAVLAVLLCRALDVCGRGRSVRERYVRAGLAVLVTLLYAVTDEIHQSFVPGRGPSPVDVFIDLLGGLIGTSAYVLRSRSQRGVPDTRLC